jgi:transposase
MARLRARRSRKFSKDFSLQRPSGQLNPRVEKVVPEHFGIVAIDCAKARSRYLLADFYGKTLLPPSTLPHSRGDFEAALQRLRQAIKHHQLHDLVVAIERTGEYHRPVLQAFRQGGFETRLVHPLTSKHYRQPADPGNKTDDTDLAAIFRATTQGFGLREPTWPDLYVSLQLLHRQRRDLVKKNTTLRCQIREVLHAAMPGYAECFCHLFESPAPLIIARQTTSADAVRAAGIQGLKHITDQSGIICQPSTFHKLLAWAEQAPPGSSHSLERRRILSALDDDRLAKIQQITELERYLAHLAVQTPYVLLLAIPGINIVTIADLAGELGPMPLYLNANAITGRAGLMPCRYQSDQVDHARGPLRPRGHRRLRAVLMQTASNLVHCNQYFRARAELWSRAGKDPRWIRVKVAKIFSRLAYAMIAGRQIFRHPCCQERHFILGKLMEFHTEHRTPPEQMRQDLEAAVAHMPTKVRAQEAQPLRQQLDELAKHRRGAQPLAKIIPLILARLAERVVKSKPEGEGP